MKSKIDALAGRKPLFAFDLETVAELTEVSKSFETCDVAEVSVSKPRTLGRYRLMTAQNPVYIFTMQHEIKD